MLHSLVGLGVVKYCRRTLDTTLARANLAVMGIRMMVRVRH